MGCALQFVEKIRHLTSESTFQCYQCGICSGACPLRIAMDNSPMQIIRMIELGLEEKLFSSNTIWICSTCFSCQIRCPQGINIPKLMEALRQIHLRRTEDQVRLQDLTQAEYQKLPQIALISNQRKFGA